MIPLFHDFTGKRVVVVGGGPVAHRKARRFVDEADVTVVAPEFVEGFEDLPCELVRERVDKDTVDELVSETFLVVVATDDKPVNETVAAAAQRAGCLVNRADRVGEVVVPSHIESTELSVAISTRGASPTTTKYLRQQLTPLIEETDGMVALQRELRAELKETVPDQSERKRLLRSVIDTDAVWEPLPVDTETALTRAREVIAENR
jgi:precorrin-2 dehydrogenase/sirohydrochlorin ferrochelatase